MKSPYLHKKQRSGRNGEAAAVAVVVAAGGSSSGSGRFAIYDYSARFGDKFSGKFQETILTEKL